MSPTALTCQELVELVTHYLEDALAPVARSRFEAHLRDCEGCQVYLDQMRQTIRLTGQLSEASLSDAARRKLLDVFRDWKGAGATSPVEEPGH